jgi:hypothetical protein
MFKLQIESSRIAFIFNTVLFRSTLAYLYPFYTVLNIQSIILNFKLRHL